MFACVFARVFVFASLSLPHLCVCERGNVCVRERACVCTVMCVRRGAKWRHIGGGILLCVLCCARVCACDGVVCARLVVLCAYVHVVLLCACLCVWCCCVRVGAYVVLLCACACMWCCCVRVCACGVVVCVCACGGVVVWMYVVLSCAWCGATRRGGGRVGVPA